MLNTKKLRAVVALLMTLVLVPSVAFAYNPTSNTADSLDTTPGTEETSTDEGAKDPDQDYIDNPWYLDLNAKALAEYEEPEDPAERARERTESFQEIFDVMETEMEHSIREANKVLPYSRSMIDQIGTQERSGHTICCPSFSCAYADAIIDGTINSHAYYGCRNCRWTDWGGGNSSFRNLGSGKAVLREAYDQITAGKPTVIHLSASYGEHWITLIGYQNAVDPDNLTLANFIGIDPWDGSEVPDVSARFNLYGDNCQHISSR